MWVMVVRWISSLPSLLLLMVLRMLGISRNISLWLSLISRLYGFLGSSWFMVGSSTTQHDRGWRVFPCGAPLSAVGSLNLVARPAPHSLFCSHPTRGGRQVDEDASVPNK